MADTERRLGYRPALDGLRGVAVVLVVVYHLNDSWLPGGWIGVDLFFVLSGFLITTLLIEEHQRDGSVWLSGFYQRRVLRLLPAMVTFLAGVAAYRAVFEPSWLPGFSDWLPRVYITNAIAAFGLGDAGLAHIWSLAAEEQFYLLWPPLLVALLNRCASRSTVIAATAGLVVASTAMSVGLWAQGAYWKRLYFGPDTHAAAILVGCLLAELWVWDRLPRLERLVVPSVAVLGVLVTVAHPEDRWLYAGGLTVIGLAGAVLVVALLRYPTLARPFEWRRLVRVGRYSYAIYLWHPLLIHALGGSLWMSAAAAVASYPLAAVSMRVVEGPFLALKHRVVRPVAQDVGSDIRYLSLR